MFIEFYKSRLLVALLSSVILTICVVLMTIVDTVSNGNEISSLGIDILFSLIMTLSISLPVALVLAPVVAFLLKNSPDALKLVAYVGLPACIAYGISSGLRVDLLAVFGGLGGLIFYLLEKYRSKLNLPGRS